MALDKLLPLLAEQTRILRQQGIAKADEKVISGFVPAQNGLGPRVVLQDYPGRTFLRMNSNAYLGLERHPRVIAAETAAAEIYGTGPGAVRFISGTFAPHVELEGKLARFHQREAAMLFSAAYAAVIGTLSALFDEQTLVISDALNHNCIINAIKLSRIGAKAVYPHLQIEKLADILAENKGRIQRVCVVSDGVFSMRGDHAPLQRIIECCQSFQDDYEQGIFTVIDDSHGVAAFGESGRGTEEICHAQADILIATLGKGFGVNGGYVVADRVMIDYLREKAVSYIYSNPITPAEAAAASVSLDIVDSDEGRQLLQQVRQLATDLRAGIRQVGYDTLDGSHPVVPILVRDTERTAALVKYLFENNILTTGLNYPVVAKGEQEIRLQVCASHTAADIDALLQVLSQAGSVF